ncbi:UNVERIFIED_CONTAM: UDP-glycosyltransferase 86A1 [Sesamum latifolium]|uniref:UDP-glycosyltransferase 86A1 n=1 Tax=Sesamum latifolium TaxID=2727402 RepID=A0AAW2U082_9LAMI
MVSLPVLRLSNFSLPFDVTTDASQSAIGAVLSQQQQPIAFFSKKLSDRMQAASAYDREMFAISEAVRNGVNIYLATPAQQKWLTKLLGYDFEIHYTPGRDNRVADALSRRPEPTAMLRSAVTSAIPSILEHLHTYYLQESDGQTLVQHLLNQPHAQLTYSASTGLVMCKDRIYAPQFRGWRQALLTEFHDTATGGHSGVRATAARLSASFYCPGMLTDVKAYIKRCVIYQHSKYSTQKPLGTLQPLPVPQRVWEDLSMDFITHLPVSAGKTVIWVVVDRLTKTIVSDRDRLFLSGFWRELFRLSGTTLAFSTAYHPQSDGQTEVLNRVLETYLRCLYPMSPPSGARFYTWPNIEDTDIAAVGDLVKTHRDILALVKHHLGRARQRMKTFADSHRQEHTFTVGDWALLRLQPYRQQSVHRRPSFKLSRRYFGPFRISRQIGPVAFELELPVGARIHPVFHVSLLKPYHGPLPESIGQLPPDIMKDQGGRQPFRILGRRDDNQLGGAQVLVQWEGQDPSDASWVSLSEFTSAHPTFDLGDKPILDDFPSRVDKFIGNLIESSDPSSLPFLVADALYPWPATIAKKYNVVNVSFWTGPAVVLAINYYYFDHLRTNGHFPPTDDPLYSIDYIPGVESIRSKDLMPYLPEADTTTIVHKVLLRVFEEVKKADFILHNTVQELELHTLSTLNQNQPTYAIGPVNFSPECIKTRVSKSLLFEIDCSKWLESKPPGSVLYVSFGSNVPTNKQVIEAIAQGLLLSEVSFILVIRPKIVRSIDDNKNILPAGFEDNVKDKGLIVPWCNQNAVLSNPAIGGFLTLCGWNSILESMWYGVPLICYPIMYDQPTNRKLVVDDWKIGVNLFDGVSVNGAEVALKIKQLMSEKTSGGIRNEMMKFRSVLHDALSEEGSSNRNFDQFIQDLRHKMHVEKENVSLEI